MLSVLAKSHKAETFNVGRALKTSGIEPVKLLLGSISFVTRPSSMTTLDRHDDKIHKIHEQKQIK